MEVRCAKGKNDCEDLNPCYPLCVPGQKLYPGRKRNFYVECGEMATCMYKQCEYPKVWNEETKTCMLKECEYPKVWNEETEKCV